MLCAFARDRGDFLLPIHLRSGRVADARGLLSVVPKAAHQPGVGDYAVEAQVYWTVLREIYEELFGGEAAERNPGRAKHDWYCDENPAVRCIRDGEFGAAVQATGFGIDSTSGNYFVANLVVIPDPGFWNAFGHAVETMWEHEKRFILLSSRDPVSIASYLKTGVWSSDSLFTFVEGLLSLKSQYPDRVELPEFARYLVEGGG